MVTDIRDWLEQLGLADQASTFITNDVDLEALPHLTEAMLKEMGLTVGVRAKVMAGIEILKSAQSAIDVPPEHVRSARADPFENKPKAERRHLSVMFCDLVGSTALSNALDPEELRALIGSYHAATARVIERYDGHVAQYLGDGVLAYFGWPTAHEDDVERALRAGLDTVQQVKQLDAPVTMQVRIGVATGLVVVGDSVGGEPDIAIGETPNLAARLQNLAGAGEIVIDSTTKRLAGSVFEFTDIGAHTLKGFSDPIELSRVSGLARLESRFDSQSRRLIPFVGRDPEIRMLLERWENAKDGEGQVVLLEGEAGIGKSRLVRELSERIKSDRHAELRYQCSPHHTSSALHPVIEQLERAAGLESTDDANTRLDKLEAILPGPDQTRALFATLLSIESARYAPLGLTPQKQKELTFQALVGRLETVSREEPALLLVEDAHWLDPTTQEALDLQFSALAELRVLAIVTYRPEYRAPWRELSHATPLRLSRLGRRYARLMVETAGSDLSDALRAEILAKTDGIPLFVEEMTEAARSSTLPEKQEGRLLVSSNAPTQVVPSSLQSALTARLDRLGPVKELAQVAACIGRHFSRTLLAAMHTVPDPELDAALSTLVESGLVHAEGLGERESYVFKHFLIQQAAYASLLNSRRQSIHAQIAAGLITLHEQNHSSDPIVIARHLRAAQQIREALPWLVRAAQRAANSGSVQESMKIIDGAFELLAQLQSSPEEHARSELELQIAKLPVYIAINGWASEDAKTIAARALNLAVALGDKAMESSILYEIATMHEVRGEYDQTQEVLARRYQILPSPPEPEAAVESGELMACSTFYQGRFDTSIDYAKEALSFADPQKHTVLGANLSEDPTIACLFWLSKSLLLQGQVDQARARGREALDLARRSPNWYAGSQADIDAALLYAYEHDYEGALRQAEQAIISSARVGLGYREAVAKLIHEWASAAVLKAADAGKLHGSLGLFRQVGAMIGYEFYLSLAAETHAQLGEIDRSEKLIQEALQTCARSRGFFYESELHRLSGDFALIRSGSQARLEAENCYERASRIAREQGARLLELRTANSLARLWLDQKQRARAYHLLAPLYESFAKGCDTADLTETRTILEKSG